jgi:tripartite-type tricarboxylate transporter receptor subunit TctC
MPDVATLTELGLGKEKVARWFGVAAPAGTPPAIVRKLHDAFIAASKDPALVKRLHDNGTPIHTTTPGEMVRLLSEENDRTKELVEALNLKQK